MKSIYIIRHAKSSWDDISTPDIKRRLSKRGIRDGEFISKVFKKKKYFPEKFIISSSTRTRLTAGFFVEELGNIQEDVILLDELYGASDFTIMKTINNCTLDVESIAIIVHNPGITSFINRFTNDYIMNVPTLGVGVLRSEADNWNEVHEDNTELIDYFFPKMFSK